MAGTTTVRPGIADTDEGFLRLIALLDEQRSAILELDAITRERRDLIRARDGEGLLAMAARRQGVIDRLAKAADAGKREREQWETGTIAEWRSREVRRRIEEMVRAHERLEKADTEDAALLAAAREEMARELADLATGQRAVSAYGPAKADGPRFQDTRG